MELEPALGWAGRREPSAQLNTHPFAGPDFAATFDDVVPVEVPAWGTHVLSRPIPGTARRDAAGCYPFVPLASHADLKRGIAQLRQKGFVSVVMVTDPLHMPAVERMRAAFDVCRPFKTHYVFDRTVGPINRSHARWRRVQIAREALQITEVPYADHIADWARLYGNLTTYHGITGALAFDAPFFERLASVSGIRAVAGFREGVMVSAMLYAVHSGTASSFLAGTSPEGRRFCAHYGLYAEVIERFTDVALVNLGGVPGHVDDPDHGVAHVKRKLTNTTRQSFLCGAVLDREAYLELGGRRDFFPAYRAPPLVQAEQDT